MGKPRAKNRRHNGRHGDRRSRAKAPTTQQASELVPPPSIPALQKVWIKMVDFWGVWLAQSIIIEVVFFETFRMICFC